MRHRLPFILLLWFPASVVHAADRPNVLFILTDDQAYDTVGALGRVDIDTPHLDRLASAGTMFTHAYNMGSWSGAVCIPSRTMLVTGRHLWRARAVYDTTEAEREAGRFWPVIMRRAGYDTYFTGKWHIRADPEQAFDVVKHPRPGMPRDAPGWYDRPHEGRPDPWDAADPALGGYWEGGRHWSEVLADDVAEFFERAKDRRRPLFMYVAFNAPHDPRQSPREYLDRYPLERMSVPASFLPRYPYSDAIGCGTSLRDEALAPFPRTAYAVKVHRQEYHALITHTDAQVGRILDALERSGLADDTWVFFTSDHGLAVGRHGLMGKQNMYDHSLRVPFIVAGPGVPRGRRVAAPIYLQDVMPTVLDLAGVERPEHVDFTSLLPFIRDDADAAPRDAIYGAYLDIQRAVIHDGWKLILYPVAGVVRLYHLAEDPGEINDLAGDPEHVPIMRRLFARFVELQKEMDDPLDLSEVFPALSR